MMLMHGMHTVLHMMNMRDDYLTHNTHRTSLARGFYLYHWTTLMQLAVYISCIHGVAIRKGNPTLASYCMCGNYWVYTGYGIQKKDYLSNSN